MVYNYDEFRRLKKNLRNRAYVCLQVLKLRTLDRGGVDSSNPFEDDITFMDEEDGDGSAQFMDKGGRNPFLQPEGRESTSPFSEKVSFFCVLIIC